MAIELIHEQQEQAIALEKRISDVMTRAAYRYIKLLIKEADRLPANEFLELSDGIIRSASLEAVKLLTNSIQS